MRGGMVYDTVTGGNGYQGSAPAESIGGTANVYMLGDVYLTGDYYEEVQYYSLVNGTSGDGKPKGMPDFLVNPDSMFASTILTGGSNSGTINGGTNVRISNDASIWDVQAAGRSGNSVVNGTASVDVSGNAVIRHSVCGSITDGITYTQDSQCVKDISITVGDSSKVAAVYGGGYDTFYQAKYVSMYGDGSKIEVNIQGNCIVGDVYGGGYRGSIGTSTDPIDSITVNIKGGTVLGDVYGGGSGGVDKIHHNPDGTPRETTGFTGSNAMGHSTGYGLVYADSISVNIGLDATVMGNVYGGGKSVPGISTGYKDASYESHEGVASTHVHGEGITVNINSAFEGYDAESTHSTIHGSVFGAGKGVTISEARSYSPMIEAISPEGKLVEMNWTADSETYLKNESEGLYSDYAFTHGNITVNILDTNASVSENSVDGNVYGAGEFGRVGYGEDRIELNLGNAVIGGDVFVGGYGQEHKLSTNVRDRSLTINGTTIHGSVYGGSRLGNDNCDSSEDGMSITNFSRGNLSIRLISGGLTMGKSGSIYGGSFRGYSNMDVHIRIGTPALESGEAVSGDLYVASVYGGASVGDPSEGSNLDEIHLKGDVKIEIGNGDWPSGKTFMLTGNVYGEGDYCANEGHTEIDFLSFDQGSSFLSIQKADVVLVEGSKLTLDGNIDGSVNAETQRMSLSHIGELVIKKGVSTPSSLVLNAGTTDILGYSSLENDGTVGSEPGETTASEQMNSLTLNGGMAFSVLGTDNQGAGTTEFMGYTLLKSDPSSYYGALAIGVTSSVYIDVTGFYRVVEDGGKEVITPVESIEYKYTMQVGGTDYTVGATMWFLKGTYKIETTAILNGTSNADGSSSNPSAEVEAWAPRTAEGSTIYFVGGYLVHSSPGIPNLVGDDGLQNPGKDLLVKIGIPQEGDGGRYLTFKGGPINAIDTKAESSSNGVRLLVSVETLNGYNFTGYVGTVVLNMVEMLGGVPINAFDVEIGVYLRVSDCNSIKDVAIVRKEDGVYSGTKDIYLPVSGTSTTEYYLVGVNADKPLPENLTLIAYSVSNNLNKDGWVSAEYRSWNKLEVSEPGEGGILLGTGGSIPPVLRLEYTYRADNVDDLQDIQLEVLMIDDTGKGNKLSIVLSPKVEENYKIQIMDKDSADYTEYLQLTLKDSGSFSLSSCYVGVSNNFEHSESLDGFKTSLESAIFQKMVYTNRSALEEDIGERGGGYTVHSLMEFLSKYFEVKGIIGGQDYTGGGWYRESTCEVPINDSETVSMNIHIYAGYPITLTIKGCDENGTPLDGFGIEFKEEAGTWSVDLGKLVERIPVPEGRSVVYNGSFPLFYADNGGSPNISQTMKDLSITSDTTVWLVMNQVDYEIVLRIDGTQSYDWTLLIGEVINTEKTASFGDKVSISFSLSTTSTITVTAHAGENLFSGIDSRTSDNKSFTLSFDMPAGDVTIDVTTDPMPQNLTIEIQFMNGQDRVDGTSLEGTVKVDDNVVPVKKGSTWSATVTLDEGNHTVSVSVEGFEEYAGNLKFDKGYVEIQIQIIHYKIKAYDQNGSSPVTYEWTVTDGRGIGNIVSRVSASGFWAVYGNDGLTDLKSIIDEKESPKVNWFDSQNWAYIMEVPQLGSDAQIPGKVVVLTMGEGQTEASFQLDVNLMKMDYSAGIDDVIVSCDGSTVKVTKGPTGTGSFSVTTAEGLTITVLVLPDLDGLTVD